MTDPEESGKDGDDIPRKPALLAERASVRVTGARPESADTRTAPESFVDADEAAEFLRLPRRRVLQLARQGKFPAYPIGDGVRKVWRFRLSELATAMLHFGQRSHVPTGET